MTTEPTEEREHTDWSDWENIPSMTYTLNGVEETGGMEGLKSPAKAIRVKCLDCCCYNAAEVKRCTLTKCMLFPFRMGKNPFHRHKMTDEQRQAASERMKALVERQRIAREGVEHQ